MVLPMKNQGLRFPQHLLKFAQAVRQPASAAAPVRPAAPVRRGRGAAWVQAAARPHPVFPTLRTILRMVSAVAPMAARMPAFPRQVSATQVRDRKFPVLVLGFGLVKVLTVVRPTAAGLTRTKIPSTVFAVTRITTTTSPLRQLTCALWAQARVYPVPALGTGRARGRMVELQQVAVPTRQSPVSAAVPMATT